MKHYLPIEKAARPVTGKVIVDGWWIVHPDKGLLFRGRDWSPQYNRHREVAEAMLKIYPGHEVRQVPLVFLANVGGSS